MADGLGGSLGWVIAADVPRSVVEPLITAFASEGEALRKDGAFLEFSSCISTLRDADCVGPRSSVTAWLWFDKEETGWEGVSDFFEFSGIT